MFCPTCRDEFRPGFDRCENCGVSLVHELPEVDHSAEEQVLVHETSRPSDIPVVKSLLRGAEIPFLTEGESLDRLFPSELHITMTPGSEGHRAVHFLVPESRAEEARALLSEDAALAQPAPEELL